MGWIPNIFRPSCQKPRDATDLLCGARQISGPGLRCQAGYPLPIKDGNEQTCPFLDDILIKTSIYREFPFAMFDCRKISLMINDHVFEVLFCILTIQHGRVASILGIVTILKCGFQFISGCKKKIWLRLTNMDTTGIYWQTILKVSYRIPSLTPKIEGK